MRGFEERRKDFDNRGIRVVAISADAAELIRQHCARQGYSYTFLSDEKTEVIRRYDLLHPRGGQGGHDISRPAEFLVDPTGTVRWVNLTDDVRVRTRPEQVLKAIDELGLASSAGGK